MYRLIITVLLVLFLACKQEEKKAITETKKNEVSKFVELKENLVYKDSNNAIYLKIKRPIIGTDSIVDFYEKRVGINDSVTIDLGKVIDVNSFNRLGNSEGFYKDKNNVYVFQEFPATYPQFKVIDINPSQAVVFRNEYIKDKENVYFLGIQISKNASQFKFISNKENLNLFGDTKNIIWNWTKLNYEDFKELHLPDKTNDSLQKIYFAK